MKLSGAIKIADTSNQGKVQSKVVSAIAITFGEDTKPFYKTKGVFKVGQKIGVFYCPSYAP